MLRVSIDIVPYGIENQKRNIYTVEIVNIGREGITVNEKGEPRHSYKVRTIDEAGKRTDHGVLVKGFNRQLPASVLVDLAHRTLMAKGII